MTFNLKTFRWPAQVAFVLLASLSASAQTPPPIDLAKAKDYFAEAKAYSDRDGGRLWGTKLYGAIFFVEPDTRFVVANEPDPDGVLHADDGLYVGTLPQSVIVSNAPAEWEGKRWTMLIWQTIPEDAFVRRIMFEHESFHRIQPALHLMAPDTPGLHLDTQEGRLWMQLEWHAPASARWHTIGRLTNPDQSATYVRFFPYISGPPYGLLLDERLPGWRTKLNEDSDLGEMLASTLKGRVTDDAEARADIYGAAAIRIAESDRARKADAEKARYRALLVDGPTLLLPRAGKFAFSFNPSTLISLGDAGTVYPTFHVVSGWGTLDVKEGALVPTDFSRATVAAPSDTKGSHISGPGWTLDLAPGWTIVPAAKAGNYMVKAE
jgi:hypothetical protein